MVQSFQVKTGVKSLPIMAEGTLADPIVVEDCAVSSPVKILEGSEYR